MTGLGTVSRRPRQRRAALLLCGTALAGALLAPAALAADAVWNGLAGNSNYSSSANWVGGVPAEGTGSIATFGPLGGANTTVTLDQLGNFDIGTLRVWGAKSYVFDKTGGTNIFDIGSGLDIENGSSATFNISLGSMQIRGGSAQTAAINVLPGAALYFQNNSSAGDASINSSSAVGFFGMADAGTAKIQTTGQLGFWDLATADFARITATGGTVTFGANSSALFADIAASNAAIVSFQDDSRGANARISLFDTASLDLSSHNAGTITLVTLDSPDATTTVNLGANTLAVGGPALDMSFAGAISGTGGSLAKTGGGRLILSGANTYNGTTAVSGGVLNVQNGAAFGTSTVVVSNGAGLEMQSGSLITVTNALTLNGTGSLNGGALRNVAGNNRYNGAITLGSNTRINSDADQLFLSTITGVGTNLTVGGAGNTSVGNVTLGTGGITKDGTGGFALAGVSTYTGATTVNNGVLQLNNGSAIPDAGAVILNAPGRLNLQNSETIGSLAGSGNISLNAATLTTGGNNTTTTYSGIISGAGALVKAGTGTLTLTGANSYAGGTTVAGGILELSGPVATLGAASARTTVSGATLDLGGTNQTQNGGVLLDAGSIQGGGLSSTGIFELRAGSVSANLSGTGQIEKNGAGTLILSGSNSYSGGTRIAGGTLVAQGGSAVGDNSSVLVLTGSTFRVLDDERVATLSGSIGDATASVELNGADLTLGSTTSGAALYWGSITGSGGIVKDGNFRQVLAGNNSYDGATQILGGTLFAVGAGKDSISDGSAVTVAAGAKLSLVDPSLAPIFTGLESDDETIGSLAGAGTVDLGAQTLTVGGNNASTTFSGVITGSGGLTKTGSGTLILSGSSVGSPFTGTATVNQGILRVDGVFGDTVNDTAQVNVAGGGTLQGNGTVAGDVAVQSNGTLSAGASPGMLTIVGDLALDAGSTSVFEFGTPNVAGGPTNDLVTVGGNLTMGGTLNVSAASAGYYRLFDVGGIIAGAFDALVTPGFTDADVFVIPNQVNLSVRNASQLLQHWDGPDASAATPGAGGGDGVWDGTGTNWTADPIAGAINDAWRGSVAVFGGAAGTVVVAPGTPSFDTLQFNTNGYHLLSGNLAIGVAGANAGNAALTGSVINVTTGTTTIDSVIQDGAGNHLNLVGSGTLVLTGANTYTGGTSLLGSRVSVDSDANLGAASGGLTFDGGILQVRGTAFTSTGRAITWGAAGGGFDISSAFNTFTVSQSLGGTGGLSKLGAGTLVLSGANSYSGGTTISQGTLSVGATGALGSGAVAVGTGSSLLFQNGTSAGSLRLNTAFGTGPGVNGGFIQFADGSSADHAQIENGLLGAIEFRGSATAGAAQIGNVGAVNFRESASAGEAQITNFPTGSTNFLENASAGQATITSTLGGLTYFFDSSTAANAFISSNGTVVFDDTSSAGSASIVTGNGGRILFRADAEASGARIRNVLGSAVDISQATSGTVIGALSGESPVLLGSKTLTVGGLGGNEFINGIVQDGGAGGGTGGSLIKTGAGTLVLTGTNTYTGTTTINAGTLQVSADANLGAGGLIFNGGTLRTTVDMTSGRAVTFIGNGTLLTDAGTTLTLSGGLTGSSGLTKTGAGTLALTGDSSAFAGTASVGQGVLSVNGRLGGSVEILAGGRLQGTGTVGAVTVAGAIAPGNSIGTLTVNGNYTQLAGSTYEAEIAPDGSSDRIDVTGAASIQGGTVFAAKATGSYTPGSRYTILTAAGGVTGTYAALDQNAPFIDLALGYDPKTVYLDVIRNAVAFPTIGETPNQKAVAAAAESLGEGNALYNAIAGVPDVPSALAAFDSLSGEMNASTVTGLLEDSRFVREAMNDRLRSAFETVGAVPLMSYGDDARELATAAVPSERYGAWGSVFGSWGHFDSDGNAAKLSRSVGGFVTGIDGSIVDDVRLGFLAGYSHSSLKVDDRRSSASTDNYHLGIYGGTEWGALAFRSGLAYTWSEIDSGRQVSFPGFTDSLTGNYRAGTTQVFGELGYGIKAGSVALEPFANLAYVNVHTNGFTEQGGASALTVESGSNDVTFTTLGLRASTDFDLGTMKATARGMIGWRHGFGDITPMVSQAFTGSSLFQIAGAPIAKDAATLEAGLDFAIAPRATLGVSYQGQLGSGVSDHGVRADFSVKF